MILSRLGNKRRTVPHLLPHIPPHDLWIEPFFGAGGMFFRKPKARRSIVNDRDSEVYNLFCVVQDRPAELEEAWTSMPIHEDLWNAWKQHAPVDPVWRAVRFLFQSNFGYLGLPQTLTWGKGPTKQLLLDKLAATRRALFDVEFMNCDFREMLHRIPLDTAQRASAFIYADPPYLDTANNYGEAGRWVEQDTADLFDELMRSGMRFAISEFDTPRVVELAKERGLHVQHIHSRKNLMNRRTEILITDSDRASGRLF